MASIACAAGLHDSGPKTVLGQTGAWDGGDVVRIVLEQPAAARFLVRKLYHFFVSENAVPPDAWTSAGDAIARTRFWSVVSIIQAN